MSTSLCNTGIDFGEELRRERFLARDHAKACQGTIVEVAAVQESIDESMRLRNRQMAKNTNNQLDSNAQLLLSTTLGGCKSRNDGIVADTSSDVRLRIEEDL